MDVEPCLRLTQRTFAFGEQEVAVACRQPPEELGRITLTLQAEAPAPADSPAGGGAAGGSLTGGGGPTAAAPDPIGLDLWPASIALCHYLAAHPQVVAGQRLLELGAGMGLAGILAARLGARSVLLTDYEPLVLEQLGRNAELSGVSSVCSTLRLDWHRLGDLPPSQRGSWWLLLAADVLYARVIVSPFVATLEALLHPEGVAVVAHQVRRAITLDPKTKLPRLEDTDEPYEAFLAICGQAGLHVRVLSSRETCSNVDTDPMLLLAVGRIEEAVRALPGWANGASAGSGPGSNAQRGQQ